jgi:class 3 adenylate cyclase
MQLRALGLPHPEGKSATVLATFAQLRCNDDVEAIRLAKQLVDADHVELWQLDRHVETFRHTSERLILRQ